MQVVGSILIGGICITVAVACAVAGDKSIFVWLGAAVLYLGLAYALY